MISSGLRFAFSHLARLMCEQLTRSMPPPRVIVNRAGDAPYLERYYLLGGPSEDGTFADAPLTVIIHHFVRSDEDGELHSHPWEQSMSFMLAGGYSEERRCAVRHSDGTDAPDTVVRAEVLPFNVNFIASNDFHRVDLLEHDCWSLFVTSRKNGSWFFWNRATGETTPWRDFIAKRRNVDPSSLGSVKRSEDVL